MLCPRDRTPLTTVVRQTPRDRVEIDVCDRCHGAWFDRHELAAALGIGNLEAFAPESPLLEGDEASRPCPRNPGVRMHKRHLTLQDASLPKLEIDQCAECGGIWLDGGELPQTIAALRDQKVRPFLEDPELHGGSAALWLFMFFTGLPIEQWNPRARRPVVVPTLVALCVLAFLWQISGGAPTLQATVMTLGLVPARLFAGDYRTLVTYMFMHGGWAHLVGNMYFLWVFGDNVEDRLGRGRFLLLYLTAGVVAGLCFAVFEPNKDLPVVGASGAISGVMAAYAVLFPRTRLISLILFFRVRWRASVYLAGWLLLQIIGLELGQRGIAWWAHIGGFVVGAAFALGMRQRPTAPTALSGPSSPSAPRA